jgi:hypothetical protein
VVSDVNSAIIPQPDVKFRHFYVFTDDAISQHLLAVLRFLPSDDR